MVVFLQYSALEIFSVCLPSLTLDSQMSPKEVQGSMVPQNSKNNVVIAVSDNEPASIISYALSSKEYKDPSGDKPNEPGVSWNACDVNIGSSESSNVSAPQSHGTEDASEKCPISLDQKTSLHLSISFEDESPNVMGKVKFSVTCYFAKQFDSLRKRCCAGELDFIRSLSRCSAQGEKSNVYFAKSWDERFIIKQITKTQLESFEEFAPEYFKYVTESLAVESPTCLAKILGIYQVTIKHLKGDKDVKMDLMVMENLFFQRKISKVYSIKDSARSHNIPNITDANEGLLDMNILETIGTIPIFLGSKAKRAVERAVWNDSSFLESVNVTDYSLLVAVDEGCQELVLGIIDFMTQYTLDKHLGRWIKASCILGGTKNDSSTVISPRQHKKRLRKAVNASFLTVPV